MFKDKEPSPPETVEDAIKQLEQWRGATKSFINNQEPALLDETRYYDGFFDAMDKAVDILENGFET